MRSSVILKKPINKPEIVNRASEKTRSSLKARITRSRKAKLSDDKISEETYSVETDIDRDGHETPQLLRDPTLYDKIQEIPVYEATTEEYSDPILLIEKLSKMGYRESGCVKIRPPKTWNPEFSFNPHNKKISTRKQNLRELNEGKSFDQNVNGYTLEEYKNFADNFEHNYKYKAPFNFNNKYRANEYEYWAHVEDPLFQDEDVIVEYAADLSSAKYGSGFPSAYRGRLTDDLNTNKDEAHPFNLNNLSRARDSLFQIITRKQEAISGISSSWMYSGMMLASFCWHVEDLYMYSINYMHKGAAKTWYCVPEKYKEAFDDVIKEKFGLLFIKDPNLLHNICLTMNPLELVKRNIPVFRTEQQPGEFILTFPKVYHAGFSHGFNISEAVNLAVPDWIQTGYSAAKDYARDGFGKKNTFPMEWIIVDNIMRVNELDFSEETRKKLIEEYVQLRDKELKEREIVTKCYSKVQTKVFDSPNLRYDAHTCHSCKNYCFLSYLTCLKCKKSGCTNHITICECLNPKMVLNVRYTDKELEEALEDINNPEETM